MIKDCKIELIQELTNHYIDAHGLPPLAAKIYSYLLMDCQREGITFEEIIEVFNVSKSSASNSLQFLTQNKYIEPYTKIDQRKRFYRLSGENMILRLSKIQHMLERESNISQKVYDYYSENKVADKEIVLDKMQIYLDHLDNAVNRIKQTLELLQKTDI